jgi:hypothetical protein
MLPHCPLPKIPQFCPRIDKDFTERGNVIPDVVPDSIVLGRMDRKGAQVAKSIVKDATKLWVGLNWDEWERNTPSRVAMKKLAMKPKHQREGLCRRMSSVMWISRMREAL